MLTHNRPEALLRCLTAVDRSVVTPQEVIVVDNASKVGAAQIVAHSGLAARWSVRVLELKDNVGPAGGYAVGLEEFLKTGCDAVWVMDDDCVPAPECLQRLLAVFEGNGCATLVWPLELDAEGRATRYPAWSGVLIPREVVAHVGVPRAEFFWWAEDTEYLQLRIPRAGYRSLEVDDALILHDRERPRIKPAWKYYYEVRNSVYLRVHIRRNRRLLRVMQLITRVVARIVFLEKDKLLKLRLVGRGLLHGLRGVLGPILRTESEDIEARGSS